MKIARLSLPILIFFSLLLPATVFGKITPNQFSNDAGVLSEKKLIEFLLVHYKFTYQDVFKRTVPKPFIDSEHGDIQQAKKKFMVIDKLSEIQEQYGNPPYKPIAISAYIQDKTIEQIRQEEVSGTQDQEQKSHWKYGPIKFRDKFEDWNKDLKDVKGSTLSYSDNRVKDNNTWATKGNLIYPIQFFKQADKGGGDHNYAESALLPSIKWNYYDLSGGGGNDAESLTFQLPWYSRVSHNIVPKIDEGTGLYKGIFSWTSEFYVTAIYSTDFDHDGEIFGASFTYEPIIQVGSAFQTGSWHKLPAVWNPAAYLFRVIPGTIYSHVLSEGPYIKRADNDDAFGLTTSLELGIKPFGKKSPWEFKTGYDLFYDFTGDDDGYFDKWGISLSYWFNDNAALTLEHQNGDDFLTKEEVDLITIGFQIRR